MGIKENLENWMEIRRINQSQLSKRSGIPYTTIGDILTGKVKDTTTEKASKIAKALGISIDSLIGENENCLNIIDSLKLLLSSMSLSEFVKLVNNPMITEEKVNYYLSGELKPMAGSLYVIAEAFGIDFEFFYRKNTHKTLEQAKLAYQENKNKIDNNHIPSFEELDLLKKIRVNKLDITFVNNMIDLVITQNKK